MRLFLSALTAASLLVAGSLGMPGPAVAAKAPAGSHKGHYECPKCHQESTKAGTCPKCKVTLVAEGKAHAAYQCKMCKVKSAKAGKCPKCKMTMTKVAAHSHKGHKGHGDHKGHKH